MPRKLNMTVKDLQSEHSTYVETKSVVELIFKDEGGKIVARVLLLSTNTGAAVAVHLED